MSFSIDDLIDDCLLLIFYRLSLGDRIKIRLTCNRWATLMPFDDIDSLDVNSLPFAPRQFLPAQPRWGLNIRKTKIRRSSILHAFNFVLPRMGATLKSVSLGTTTGDPRVVQILLLNNYHFDLIVKYCPNLEKLEIGSNADLNHMDFARLAIELSHMPSLYTLYLCSYRLKYMQQVLFATAFGDQTWPHLTDFTANLAFLGSMVAPQLQNLTLLNVTDSSTLPKWCEAHPNLSGLKLTGVDCFISSCVSVARLTQLTYLNLEYKMNDAELSLICSNCPELIDVSLNLTRVNRFDCLRRLKCLTALSMAVAEKYDESDLVTIVKSGHFKSFGFEDQRIHTSAIPLLTMVGLNSLIISNPNLEELKFHLWTVSDETILAILDDGRQLRSLTINNVDISSNAFAALGNCEKLSKFETSSAISADHCQCLLDTRRQNDVRHRLYIWVEANTLDRRTAEIFLKEELKKVNIFIVCGF